MLLGLTHDEVGVVIAVGLVALAWAGLGLLRGRLWLLGGVIVTRMALTAWFAVEGVRADRASFIRDYGPGRTASYLADTLPTVLWGALGGGWIIVAAFVAARPPRRTLAVIAVWFLGALGLVAFTVDQTRICALVLVPLTLAVAIDCDRLDLFTYTAASIIGVLSPLVVALAGEVYVFCNPFEIRW